MSKIKFIPNLFLTALVTGLSVAVSFAQPPDKKDKPSEDISTKVRKVGKESKDVYKKWLDNDVPYLITEEEKKAFKALATDEERENFIENFWRRRDTNPDTEENEFREQYYERIAYANAHYGSGMPGWKSDRGRIYIAWGKPDSIESRPSGGSYDRPSYEGGGSITAYPFEIWYYRHLEGVGNGLEIEFVDPTGTGEYRLARDANEKNALRMNSGMDTSEQLGLNNPDGSMNNGFRREQDSLFRKMEIAVGLSRPPAVKFSDLQELAGGDSGTLFDKDPLQFDLRVDFFRQSDDRVITAFTVQTTNKQLTFGQVGGLQQATMNIFGKITAVSGKRTGIFEDSVTTKATTDELVEARDRRSVYQKAIALAPGTYKVDVVVRDVVTGNKGLVNMGFVVPIYDEKKLSTSSMVLTAKLRTTTERDIGQMFVIGNAKVIPNLSGEYKVGQEVGVYMQVYNAGVDQTTLRPAVDVNYILSKGGKEILRQPEDWSGLSDSGQRLTLARLLPTTLLPVGDYELKVQIKDRVGGQLIENKGKFTLSQ
ncbi:MAG: GWxTD domain-containing protein [Pyrinomonadaceae bacterium]